MPLLDVNNIAIAFGGLKAVSDFSLSLDRGGLYGLIGPNGAGKTTCFNLLTGVYRPNAGTIALDGRSLIGLKPSQIARAGLARTFQNIRLFGELSVLDNVRVASHLRLGHGLLGAVARTAGFSREEARITGRAESLLDMFGLYARRFEPSSSLPYGDQRRLEIARALATDPKVLLLDEPAAGMNPAEKVELRNLIREVRDRFKLTILLIEHDMGVVMGLCEHITVLDFGVTIARGTPVQVQADERVIEAYLGTSAHSIDEAIAHDRAEGGSA